MKKVVILLSVFAIMCIAESFSPKQQPKLYTLKLTDTQLNQLYYCLDKSEAEHTMVASLQQEIQKQFQAQVKADTTIKK